MVTNWKNAITHWKVRIVRLAWPIALMLYILAPHARAQAWEEPFTISASLTKADAAYARLTVSSAISEGFYLYADRFVVTVPEPVEIELLSGGSTENLKDDYTDDEHEVFSHSFINVYSVRNMTSDTLTVTISFQGCEKNVCFMPESKRFALNMSSPDPATGAYTGVEDEADEAALQVIPGDFYIVSAQSGYMDARQFIEFIESAKLSGSGVTDSRGIAMRFLRHGSLLLSIIGVILGGLALNLTPCVLPMIPINIAIIGAGAGTGRMRGFVLGGLYGAGIALAYGIAGLVVVLTGAMFGAINSSPWFNIGVAVLFLALSLSLFDVFALDLSRFMERADGGTSGRSAATILLMGAVSALLAGACVAPVVIFVLVHAASLYAEGRTVGLLLPFLLGAGMALPWPFAGAGMASLPKPGMWMNRVKMTFGLLILAASAYYFLTGALLLKQRLDWRTGKQAEVVSEQDGWITSLSYGFDKARAEGKPMVVDFWASWCKTCHAMDATTFKDKEVRKRLDDFVAVKYRAESPADSPHKEVIDSFGILGLPTIVILKRGQMP